MSENTSETDILKDALCRYNRLLTRELEQAGKDRNLQIHNTTKQVYIQQQGLIEDLLEALEEGEEIVS